MTSLSKKAALASAKAPSAKWVTAGLLVWAHAVPALAVELDRSGQGVGIIFEDKDQVRFSWAHVRPTIKGEGIAPFPGSTGSIASAYNQIDFGIKKSFSDQLSMALVIDEPYGSDLTYPMTGNGALNSTSAVLSSQAYTAVMRYKINNSFSVHGGPRYQQFGGKVRLGGAVYGSVFGPAGYEVDFGKKGALGYVAGAAYEVPDIALRLALTYNSAITHKMATEERVGGGVFNSVTSVKSPEAFNLDFQTGIAPKTLLMAGMRYAKYADTVVIPNVLGSNLTNFKNGTDYSIGLGRQFSDKFSGLVSFGFAKGKKNAVGDALSPTSGMHRVTLGGAYDVTDKVSLSGGLFYAKLGNAKIAEGEFDIANMRGSRVVGTGLQVSYKY